jgi:hypothetical protein
MGKENDRSNRTSSNDFKPSDGMGFNFVSRA